jgi:hypothetical protein
MCTADQDSTKGVAPMIRRDAGSASDQYDDDEAQDDVATFRGFLKGEWAALWPAWVLFLAMVAVIVWDRLVQF